MASYSYTMLIKNGREKKGTMEAENEGKVKALIKEEGNIPISIAPQSILSKDINLTFGNSIKPRDLSVFCRQFVSILSAGVAIINALRMMSEQTENKDLSKAIKEVEINVEKGETLADAMRAQRKVFPSLLIHMVEAGEVSGNLEIAFNRMAVHFEKDANLKAQMKKAMIYPVVVGLVAVGVVFVMMLVVIPNFIGMFEDMNMELPFMTKLVVNMSNFFKSSWYFIIGLVLLSMIGFRIYKQSPTGKVVLGKLQLKIPLYGKLIIKSVSSRFARTLSTLVVDGIPMIEALDITSKTMGNEIVRQSLQDAKEDIAKGLPLSIPIKNAGIFPPMVCHMIKIGEETGNLESMLEKAADYYDEEVKIATESLMAAMEPLIIVVLSLVVGVLIMAIMQPMMSMYSGLDKM